MLKVLRQVSFEIAKFRTQSCGESERVNVVIFMAMLNAYSHSVADCSAESSSSISDASESFTLRYLMALLKWVFVGTKKAAEAAFL